MNQDTADRLSKLSENLAKFLDLHPDEQDWLYPLLGRAEKRAILILESLQGGFKTYKQIAEEVGCHQDTVEQTLYAIDKAGKINLEQDKSGRWSTPKGGRYRALLRVGTKGE